MDEEHLEIVFKEVVHDILADSEQEALNWVAEHQKQSATFATLKGKKSYPVPMTLLRVIKDW